MHTDTQAYTQAGRQTGTHLVEPSNAPADCLAAVPLSVLGSASVVQLD